MTTYSDVFGSNTVNPSRQTYSSQTFTTDSTLQWSFNYDGTGGYISSIMDITCSTGLILTLPFASEVSKGEDFLVRNIGVNSVTIVDSIGNTITSVSSGVAKYIFVTDNSSEEGTWAVVSYGVGSSSADAASLVGYGIKAVTTSLNQAHPVVTSATGINIDTTYRSKVLVHTGGVATYTFSAVATLADDFFLLFRNSGTGTVTLDPNASELIDGASTILIQPGESLIIACSGSTLYSIGSGKSIQYNFTQLTKDITAGGTITLSSTEASNKLLTFTGTPAATVTVVVPSVVAIYYVYNSSSQSVLLKTSGGTGVTITASSRVIVFCDGTNIVSAQSATVTSALQMVDGSVSSPALYFNSETNTGFYKYGTAQLGIAIAGALKLLIGSSGIVTTASGNLSSTNLNAALAELQTDIDTRLTAAVGNVAVSGIKTATFNSQPTIVTTIGSVAINWTTAQNQKQAEPTGSINYSTGGWTAPPGPCHLQLLIDSDGTSTPQTFTWPASVIWLGAIWAGVANKKAVINFWYDGTNYFAQGVNQV
jgi:hypothetical protein